MQRLEVSGAVRPLYGSLDVKGLTVMKSPAGEICHQHSSVVSAIIP